MKVIEQCSRQAQAYKAMLYRTKQRGIVNSPGCAAERRDISARILRVVHAIGPWPLSTGHLTHVSSEIAILFWATDTGIRAGWTAEIRMLVIENGEI
jgi:hypothetical protein